MKRRFVVDFPALQKWFLALKRDFPWRESPSPYAVWISEVMLQQTRAEVVVPYFCKWMEKFPSLEALASAKEEEVLKCWEGLGYYSRARNLHKGAKEIASRFLGVFPSTEKELLSIKGVGPYTAGAILSFAFKKRAPCVDGNVLRVFARLFALEGEIDKPATQKEIRAALEKALPLENAPIASEALIELGALVCKKTPECRRCPLRSCCKAFLEGKEKLLPKKGEKSKAISLYRTVALLEFEGAYLVRKVPGNEVMGGLYEFPYIEMEGPLSCLERQALLASKFSIVNSSPLQMQKHTFTKYRATLFPYRGKLFSPLHLEGFLQVPLVALKELPFSSGHRRVLHALLQVVLPKL